MNQRRKFVTVHAFLTRRYFLGLAASGVVFLKASRLWAEEKIISSIIAERVERLEYLTPDEKFINFGRGNPPPHELSLEKRREVGLLPETWALELEADPGSNAQLDHPLSKAAGTAFDWRDLMRLSQQHAVRLLSVMSCTNGGRPCGMGIWEGVPLREVVWLSKPVTNVRRLFYYGFHNHDPKQRFQSSLPIGRVLEDPPGEDPILLCYKLNGQWLSSIRGGPVRMLVPGEYGNKSVKWLQRILLTNNTDANDTYALWNNDTVSKLKTCARFVYTPEKAKAGQSVPITGIAQVGVSGLSKVQYCLHSQLDPTPQDDPNFLRADWKNADILPPPADLKGASRIDPSSGRPHIWPMRYTTAHWAALLRDVPAGKYDLRCRTIDANGIAQPMPRPFPKSGNNAIQTVQLRVEV